MQSKNIELAVTIPNEYAGLRLDQALAQLFPEYSRARLQTWINSGACLVSGEQVLPKLKVQGGEQVAINAVATTEVIWNAAANSIPLDIVYEDQDLLIINKPANLVVHPGNGNRDNTLVNALLAYAAELQNLPRAGIVHRLDKDTSGLLVVARNLIAHNNLIQQLQDKTVTRIYEAVIRGVLTAGGTVDLAIGRDPRDRLKQAVVAGGRAAVTHYRVIQRFRGHTHIRVQLETGRTHQIRVHMAAIKHNIVGDQTYGGRAHLPKGASSELITILQTFKRQALHAKILGLQHPRTGELMQWEVPVPEDFAQLLAVLNTDLVA